MNQRALFLRAALQGVPELCFPGPRNVSLVVPTLPGDDQGSLGVLADLFSLRPAPCHIAAMDLSSSSSLAVSWLHEHITSEDILEDALLVYYLGVAQPISLGAHNLL